MNKAELEKYIQEIASDTNGQRQFSIDLLNHKPMALDLFHIAITSICDSDYGHGMSMVAAIVQFVLQVELEMTAESTDTRERTATIVDHLATGISVEQFQSYTDMIMAMFVYLLQSTQEIYS